MQGGGIGMGVSWLETLGVSPPSLETQTTVKTPPPTTKHSYTVRDAQTLSVICANPCLENVETVGTEDGFVPKYCEISNSQLGKALGGISAGAAAARVARLIELRVVKAWYETAVNTGRVTRRMLEIVQVPPNPWSPDA
jgi:hypothetical protein